jgi:tetratricopeptide (TPR) repeat protein
MRGRICVHGILPTARLRSLMHSMRILLRLSLVFALLCPAISSHAEDLAETSRRGKELLAAGQFEQAVPVYRDLVNALPGNPGPLMNLGLALHMSGQEREAVKQFQEVLRLAPNHHPARLFLGASYLGLKMPAEAVAPLRAVIRAEPKNTDARLLLGQALLALERYQSAVAQFQELTELDPNSPKAWNGLGLAYEGLASRDFVALERDALGSPYWLVLVAEARASIGMSVRAFLLYREALSKMPGLRGVHRAIAQIYRNNNHADWAAIEEEKEEQLPPLACSTPRTQSPSASISGPKAGPGSARPVGGGLSRRLECEFWAGRYNQVVALSNGTNTVPARFWRIRAYNELARQAFGRLAQLPPSAEVHELLATIHFNRKRYAESAREWEEALKRSPGNSFYQERLAVTLASGREYNRARPILEDLITKAPSSLELNYWLGFTLLELAEVDKAIPLLEKAVAADPQHPAAHKELARAFMQVGQAEKAIPHLKTALPADEDGSMHYQLSVAYRRVGQPELAKQMVEKFREIDQRARALEGAPGQKPEITPP